MASDPMVQVEYSTGHTEEDILNFDLQINHVLDTVAQPTDGGTEGVHGFYAMYATTAEADDVAHALEELGIPGLEIVVYVEGGY